MGNIRDYHMKLREKKESEQPKTKVPNKLNPAFKYGNIEDFFCNDDVGKEGDPVPEEYILFKAYDVEFLVKQKYVSDVNFMRSKKMRDFLKDIAKEHKSRKMLIGINSDGYPGVYDYSNERHIIDKEEFNMNGVDIIMERGAYDINNPKDRVWLQKVTERFKKERVVIFTVAGDESINQCVEENAIGNISYNPE